MGKPETPIVTAVNLQAVIDSDFPPVIRSAAQYISLYEYLDVGTFLEHLSTSDLEDLSARASRITMNVDSDEDFDSMFLLATILSQAEGESIDEGAVSRTSNLVILITFEDLHRKGIIDFNRKLATLSAELPLDKIAKIK